MILKFIYNMFRKQFHDLMVEDLLMHIPDKLGRTAIEVLAPKRDLVVKWLYWEANAVGRRSPVDFGNIERRNGILIMIQAFITAMGSQATVDEKKKEKKPTTPPEWRQNVEKFKNAKPPIVEEKKTE